MSSCISREFCKDGGPSGKAECKHWYHFEFLGELWKGLFYLYLHNRKNECTEVRSYWTCWSNEWSKIYTLSEVRLSAESAPTSFPPSRRPLSRRESLHQSDSFIFVYGGVNKFSDPCKQDICALMGQLLQSDSESKTSGWKKTKNAVAVTDRPCWNGCRLNEQHDRKRVLVLKGIDEGVETLERRLLIRVSLWTISFGAADSDKINQTSVDYDSIIWHWSLDLPLKLRNWTLFV